jgi:hypothetical protein
MKFKIEQKSIKWWEGGRLKFNLYAIFSGIAFLVLLYLLSLFLKHPIYFFFVLILCFFYLVALNFCYLVGWVFYEFAIAQYIDKFKLEESRTVYFKFLLWAAVGSNLLFFLIFFFEYF